MSKPKSKWVIKRTKNNHTEYYFRKKTLSLDWTTSIQDALDLKNEELATNVARSLKRLTKYKEYKISPIYYKF